MPVTVRSVPGRVCYRDSTRRFVIPSDTDTTVVATQRILDYLEAGDLVSCETVPAPEPAPAPAVFEPRRFAKSKAAPAEDFPSTTTVPETN